MDQRPRRELLAFSATLALLVLGFFADSLIGGKVLSPADVLYASKSFGDADAPAYEPLNRLLIDPVLQFQPWIEFNRSQIRQGRLPVWNPYSGCGAPHLANGQAAVFDPFQMIAYLGSLPRAHAWMAASRLWFAGLGMFLLARCWGYGGWGRWFSGLTFPFCGFLVAWLLFPVTNAAVWLPWVLLATEGVWNRPGLRSAAWLALAVGGTLLGGHVQTSAHVLLASGAYSAWLGWSRGVLIGKGWVWVLGVAWGVAIAGAEVIPLGAYLSKSPVWGDRDKERNPPWVVARPRVLDMLCTALPSLYGSQRRGEPNLARAVGVHNQNESSGGFASLVTLVWLAPLAWSGRRVQPRVKFLVGLTVFGFLGAFRFAPVDNLLRALPILNVTDNRRLSLWLAFGLVALGGVGIDRLASVRRSRGWRAWGAIWVVVSLAMLAGAGSVARFAPQIRAKALDHYARMAEVTPGADAAAYRDRGERQVRESLAFVPRYLGWHAAYGLAMAGLLALVWRGTIRVDAARLGLIGLALVDLASFGVGLNPAIAVGEDRPLPRLIARLRSEVGTSGRIIGLGSELPPNVLMRYGLLDARNYDSVELSRNLDWLAPLYDPAVEAKTSRREINWARVMASTDRLKGASVRAVVGPTAPPSDSGFDRVERVGEVWVAWLEAPALVEVIGRGRVVEAVEEAGRVGLVVNGDQEISVVVRQTFDPGWRATIDDREVAIEPDCGAFLRVRVPEGIHRVALVYDPIEVRVGLFLSIFGAIGAVFTLTCFGLFRFTRIVLPKAWTDPSPSG